MIPEHLETKNLTLRPFTEHDAKAVYDYWNSDLGWEKNNASVPQNYTLIDAQNFVAEMCARDRGQQPHWALVHKGEVIGVVSLTFEQNHGIAVIGYGVHGQGAWARLVGRSSDNCNRRGLQTHGAAAKNTSTH